MFKFLKQSTATTILMGPAVDVTDGATPETALTPTVYVSKAGGAQAARNSASAITHDRDGYYLVPLSATDTGTLGPLRAQFTDAATHLPVWEDFTVLPANVYDALVGNGLLPASISNFEQAGLDDFFADARSGVVVGGAVVSGFGVNTVTCSSWPETTTGRYVGAFLLVYRGGTFIASGVCSAYDGTTRQFTVDANWAFTPAVSDVVYGFALPAGITTAQIAAAVGAGSLGADYSNLTRDQALQAITAVLLGKVSGLPTAPVFRSPADTKNVVSASTDANGNRSSVTVTP